MNVKEAIAAAKSYIKDVYADEELSNVGLDETEYDDDNHRWNITIGFSRPWNTPHAGASGSRSDWCARPINVVQKLIVGSTNREYITRHKRLTAYTPEDFDRLARTIDQFQSIVVLPNALTDVSNFPDISFNDCRNSAQ